MPRAFISHSTANDGYVAEMESFLRKAGYDDVFNDADAIQPDEEFWPRIQAGITNCDALVVVITAASNGSDWVEREVEFARSLSKTIIPVWVEDCPIPPLFANRDVVDFRPRTRAERRYEISRILKYAPAELIGRENETKLLNETWQKTLRLEKPRPHILTFVALGGEGKTSLVAKWAAELAAQDWSGCDAAFAWSFYSQGTREQHAASSDLFLKEALNFFAAGTEKEIEDIQEFAASPAGAYEKGQRLARIVGQRRSLLILDGLEPLQYAPTSPTPGELKDQGIAALLKGLAANNRGLCLVTTRHSLPDLRAYWQTTAPEKKLLRLSKEAGVHLLKTLGVHGTTEEYESLVEDVKGHALTLQIIGGFLKRAFAGDIRQRDKVRFEKADDKIDGGHAFRAMAAYEKWLENGSDEAKRELAILWLLGLFDRPATSDSLHALLAAPAIIGLTEPLVDVAQDDWQFSLDALHTANLLTINRGASNALISLDTHPHIREFFSKQLRERQPGAWRAAHRRLYEHLCATTKEGDQPTLEDLEPLYQAVAHGCTGGLYMEAYSVFYRRILREYELYSALRLGGFQRDSGAVACFFPPCNHPKQPELGTIENAFLYAHLGYCLRSSQRLEDSLKFFELAYENFYEAGRIGQAVIILGLHCYGQIILGRLDDAKDTAEKQVQNAAGTELWIRVSAHSRVAEVYTYMGRDPEAESALYRTFEEFGTGKSTFTNIEGYFAELKKPEQQSPIIGAVIRRCEFSIAAATYGEAIEWTELLGRLSDKGLFRSELHVGLVCLFKGQAAVRRAQEAGNQTGDLEQAKLLLEKALEHFRRGSRPNEVPRTLLALASITFLEKQSLCKKDLKNARTRLDEAWEIAERGPLKLHMADIHLHRARLFFREAQYPWNQNPDGTPRGPADDLAAAEKLIIKCGYHRRDAELADAKRAILGM